MKGTRDCVLVILCSVRFGDVGAGLLFFDTSANGMTATRNANGEGVYRYVCTAPSLGEGKRIAVRSLFFEKEKCNRRVFCKGVHVATIRIDKMSEYTALGVILASRASSVDRALNVGPMYYSSGFYYGADCCAPNVGGGFHSGDVVTVRLDLDANTIAFRVNGAGTVPPQEIARGDAYHFAFAAGGKGNAVTIVECEEM